MRLIDADRLKIVFNKNIGNPQAKAIFNQYVDMQPTVTDTNVGSNWIPVSERLPEDGEWVCVNCVYFDDEYRECGHWGGTIFTDPERSSCKYWEIL